MLDLWRNPRPRYYRLRQAKNIPGRRRLRRPLLAYYTVFRYSGAVGEFTGFEWDERKNERCKRERGFDFHFAIKIFETDVDQVEDKRADYGETRFIATGQVQ